MRNTNRTKESTSSRDQSNCDPTLRLAEELGRTVGKFLADEEETIRKGQSGKPKESNSK
jgi:hypothetical protein